MSTAISTFRKPVRVLLGDRDSGTGINLYSDSAIDDAVEVSVRMGRLDGFTTDGSVITPAISTPAQYGIISIEAALLFAAANPRSYAYRTRALSESFGSWEDLVARLEADLYLMRNGGGLCSSWHNLHTWFIGITGLPLITGLSEVDVDTPLTELSVF